MYLKATTPPEPELGWAGLGWAGLGWAVTSTELISQFVW